MYDIILTRKGIPLHTLSHTNSEVRQDATAEIKRALSCTLFDLPADSDLLTDYLQVVERGTDIPVGTFVVTTAPKDVSDAGVVSYGVEAYDLTYLLHRAKVERPSDAYWPAGTKYTAAIEQLLVKASIQDWIIEPSQAVLAADRGDWDVGTSFLEIANQLLAEIGYTTVWFDRSGTCRIEPYTAPELRAVDHEYRAGDGSVIVRAYRQQDDLFDAPNVFTVCINGPDQTEPIWVQSVNDDPTSRLSTAHRGRIAAPVVQLDGVADQQAAQAYCDELKRRSMASTEMCDIQTAPESGHETLDIVSIDMGDLVGKWEEIAWTLPLKSGLMSHRVRRVLYV